MSTKFHILSVMPAKAGIPLHGRAKLDSSFRWNDGRKEGLTS
jgi:hypothetical protein